MSSTEDDQAWHFKVLDAANRIPGGARMPMATLLKRGDTRITIYAPRDEDFQQPHTQDEIYFVIRGTGHFSAGGKRMAFNAGDMLFVPAGVEHRFARFTNDLLLWVIYFGAQVDEEHAKSVAE
ncbi:MAG: cupin domain-containing protein [Rhodospirillales bacterium]|nr:cupin domain-containing protein [Rhodospirillales bacterium]